MTASEDIQEASGPGEFDVGILLVHGIGMQTSGETLGKFADPLILWLRGWLPS